MYTTPDEVMAATSYTNVTIAQVKQAQFVVEVYTGRMESEVDGARDKGLLARAVIAQTVYMRDNPEVTFEQISVQTVTRGDGMTVFSDASISPFVAPLAVLACKHLSWKKSHSVTIGKTFGTAEKARALYWLSIWGELSPYGAGFGMDGASPSEYGMLPFNPEVWNEV